MRMTPFPPLPFRRMLAVLVVLVPVVFALAACTPYRPLGGTWQATGPEPYKFDERFTLTPHSGSGGAYQSEYRSDWSYAVSDDGTGLLLFDSSGRLAITYNFTLAGSNLTLENWGREQTYEKVGD